MKAYTLSFDKNTENAEDEVKGNLDPQTAIYEAVGDNETPAYFTLPKELTRTGYTFLGWATEEGSNSFVYAGGATINANQLFTGLEGADDRTRMLYAVWQVNTYTVTLNGTNVTLSGDSTVEHNGSYELTLTAVTGYNLPETISYTVNGGSETKADVVAGKVTIGNVTGNLVIMAEGVAIGYTVTIDANGGSFGDGVQTKFEFDYGTNVYEALISTLTVTAPAYSHLSGWEVAWTQSVDGEPSMYALNGDITITAQYTATEGAVTVTIVHADGTVITLPATLGQVLRADDEIAPPDGYDYNDWYYYSNGEKVDFVFGETPVNGVITLYPNATAKKYDVAFTGTGVNAASDAVGEGKATFGQNYTVKLTVTEGYILSAENIAVTMDGTQSVRFEYNPATGMLTVYNVTGGITITATAEQLEYTVTFNYNDGSDSRTQKVAYGTAYGTLVTEQPAREGYRFRGWYLNGAPVAEDGSVTGDITLVAQWERESYSVVFDNDGMKTEYTYLYGDTVTKPADPVKEGHTFLGWYWNDKEFNFETPVSDDLDLTARWQKNTYTVTFNANGGSGVASQKVEYLGTAEMPAAPARDGYTFEGWYLNGTLWNFDEMPVTGDITLVAHWSENRYTVTFMDGDQLVASVTVAENGTVTAPALGTREGFTFEGWFNGETRFDFDAPITSKLTLTAHWRAAEYTVRFETGSGTSVSDQVIAHGGKVAMPAVPEREGYIFAGWYLDGAAWNFDEMTVSGDMTLVARWTVKTYTVAFDPDGGSSVADQTVSHNGTATAPAVPSKSGYVFEGWFNGETQFDFATAITSDITLTAKWSPRKYSVSYVLGGGTNAAGNPSEYTVESDTITLGAPTREGYTFLGWYDAELNGDRVTEIAAGSTGSITLYARWQAHTFEVSFVTNGGALDGADTQTVEAGGTVAYVEPTRENYLFVGWFTDEALTNRYDFNTAVSGELTLYAKWRLQVVTGVTPDGTVVTVSSDAGFDDGTQLHFVEITDEDAVSSAAAQLQDNMTLARLFDIEIIDANGDPVAVTEPLSVGISVEGLAEAKGSWGVVYVPDGEGEIEVLATHVGADGRLYFFVEHFSFYAVVDIVEVAAGFAWWWILVAIAGCGLLALILVLVARSARRYELNYVNGGVPAQKLKESALIDLPLPEREEEAFDGWYYDEDFRDRATLTSMPKQNLILFAKWRKLTDEERAARDRARAEAAAMAEEGFHHAAPKQEKKHKENPLSEIQEDE